jgi:hypothetical protein
MEIKELKQKPLWQMTGEEFLYLQNNALPINKPQLEIVDKYKRYVYGISGIANLFGCSKPTACRLKKSKKIDDAITQIGRKIIVDADLALQLAGSKTTIKR